MLNQSTTLDGLFRALGDGGRRSIIERLARGPASVSQLAAPLDMSLSAVVQHLKVLESTGIIESHKQGRVRTCQLCPATLDTASQWLEARRTVWEQRLDRLGVYLNNHENGDEN